MMTLSATYPESLAKHITSYMQSPAFVRLNANDPSLLGERLMFLANVVVEIILRNRFTVCIEFCKPIAVDSFLISLCM